MEQSNDTDTGDTSAQPAVPVASPRIPLVRNSALTVCVVQSTHNAHQ